MAKQISQTLESLGEKIKARSAQSKKNETQTKQTAQILQLPIWPDATRGMPNALARSALFTVRYRKTPRSQLKDRVITALGGMEIRYTGEELRQDDETVFLQLIHLARHQKLGEPVRFSAYSFLKEIGWPTSGQNHYKRLAASIDRLKANSLQVIAKPERYAGSLVRKFRQKDEEANKTNEWAIWLEPEIVALFDPVTYSRIHWQQRLELSKPLSKWLHSFYYSHKKPFPMKVETIRDLSGSTTAHLGSFRGNLAKSLGDLVTVGFLEHWSIDNGDLVHVVRAKCL